MAKYTESDLEQATLEWLEELGYSVVGGPEIAPPPDGDRPERASYLDVVLIERLKSAIAKFNPEIPEEAKEEALRKVLRVSILSPKLVVNNKTFHSMLRDGIDIEYKRPDGSIAGDKVKLLDITNPEKNDFLAVNQFTVIEDRAQRRPDVVIFVNGLPVAVIELKNPADVGATISGAFNQIQTYKNDIPSLFAFNELSIISDGMEARVGTISANKEWFTRWRTVDGDTIAPNSLPQLEVLLKGIFEKKRLLDILNNFFVFETDGEKITKKLAAYHQYHATNKAVKKTIEATKTEGDRRCGVVWHTQGSGKSLTMVFYAGKIIQELNNPTIVVLTDRNDLDDQLFGTFSRCSNLLRQTPKQAENRGQLKEYLKVASGGVVFTTIQKFLPENRFDKYPQLSDRQNIVVIADEAHRSQYDFIDGFARHMRDALPNASFIGFTGTPIELSDKNTKAVFGDYIDIYNVTQAVEDKTTVPIFYEARLAKIGLKEEERPRIDAQFEELTEKEETEKKEFLKSKWARLAAMVGTPRRIALIAKDIVDHFENRLSVIEGKGMIVVMSRRIAVELYGEILKLRPQWGNDEDDKGLLKVVMTGSVDDSVTFQKHIRTKQKREFLAKRFKDTSDEMKLVIVRDMWLTGFDVPCLHTMYLDKPMRDHGLMQTIARVNRVYKDKQGGLIVDYLGLAAQIRDALSYYASSDRLQTAIPQEEAVSLLKEKFEVVKSMYYGFNYQKYFGVLPLERTQILAAALNHILGLADGKKRYVFAVSELSKAFSLAVPHEKSMKLRDEIAFFQAIRACLVKTEQVIQPAEDYEPMIRQIISGAIVTDKIINIYSVAGIKSSNVSLFSDEFLEEVKKIEHKNLALELMQKLLHDELRILAKTNLVKSRSFTEMLTQIIKRYKKESLAASQILLELINLAKMIKGDKEKSESSKLTTEEIAFYDALSFNKSAIEVLGDKILQQMAQELVVLLKKNATIDWTIRENVQAKLRVYVKRLLKKYHYPPDLQKSATQTVLEQANLLCKDWSGER